MKKTVTGPESTGPTSTLTYEVPTQFVPIPTEGKLYGTDTNLHDLSDIEMRVMTAKDEDILTSQALIKKGIAIDRLLQNVIVDKSVDIGDMIRGDRDSLLISLRITGYGSEYEAKVACPACGSNVTEKFDLSKLPIRRLEIEPINPYINAFEFELPVTKKNVIWKFLTCRDENEILETQKRRKSALKTDADNMITQKLIHSIISIDGISNKTQISNFVKNMPARDSVDLRTYMDENEPKILMLEHFTCDECGESAEVTVPMAVQFFWPNIRA